MTTPTRAPDPPWWDIQRSGEPRVKLTRAVVVDAALAVLDDSGLNGLTMRAVADRLDTGPASLYWHVADKGQLIDLVLDRAMAEIDLPVPDPSRWKDQLREFAYSSREMFQRHADLGAASLGRIPIGPSLMRIAEWLLALLRGAGVPDRPAAWFADLLALVGAAQAIEDHMAATADPGTTSAMADYMRSLPVESFPNLVTVSGKMASGDPDDRFEFSVELMIRGIATFIEP